MDIHFILWVIYNPVILHFWQDKILQDHLHVPALTLKSAISQGVLVPFLENGVRNQGLGSMGTSQFENLDAFHSPSTEVSRRICCFRLFYACLSKVGIHVHDP